jgi:TubC N-terminal docking domain
MNTAVELVTRLRARGIALEPDGGTLVVRPAEAVQPEEVEALKSAKAEVLALLASESRQDMQSDFVGEVVPPTPDVAGEVLEVSLPEMSSKLSYSFPWPDTVPGLGSRSVGAFALCAKCSTIWSWVRYADTVLCLPCAKAMLMTSAGSGCASSEAGRSRTGSPSTTSQCC